LHQVTDPRRQVGADGEEAAVESLRRAGFEVLERNARTRYGEIDIVGLDGPALVFIEVKALRGAGRRRAEQALESIGARKRLQVRRLARAWLAERPGPGNYSSIRFDAIGVAVGPGSAEVIHIPAAF
jgi:putative endonuclease